MSRSSRCGTSFGLAGRVHSRDSGRPPREFRQLRQPGSDRAVLRTYSGYLVERRPGIETTRRRGGHGKRLHACGPERETTAKLGDGCEGAEPGEKGADDMTDANHAVRGTGEDSGAQPRPPLVENVTPRLFAQLLLEVGCPVAEPAPVTQRLLPVESVILALGRGNSSSRAEYRSSHLLTVVA
jgi:hypothetical protein